MATDCMVQLHNILEKGKPLEKVKQVVVRVGSVEEGLWAVAVPSRMWR